MEKNLVSPLLSFRIPDAGAVFNGAKNDTVTLKVGGLRAVARDYEWRTRTNPIVMDDIEGEGGMAFKLDRHVVSATGLTLEQLTLDEISMIEDVVGPQAVAVAGKLEAHVLAKFAAIPWKREVPTFTAGDDPFLVSAEAKRLLAHVRPPVEVRQHRPGGHARPPRRDHRPPQRQPGRRVARRRPELRLVRPHL